MCGVLGSGALWPPVSHLTGVTTALSRPVVTTWACEHRVVRGLAFLEKLEMQDFNIKFPDF